jgi:hypothetical protein
MMEICLHPFEIPVCSHVATTGQVGTNHDAEIAGLFRRNTLIWANRLSRPRVFDSYLDHGKDSLIIFRMRGKQVMHQDFAESILFFFRQAEFCARFRSMLMFFFCVLVCSCSVRWSVLDSNADLDSCVSLDSPTICQLVTGH